MKSIYYLSSMESAYFSDVRECIFVKEVSFPSGKKAIVAKMDPVVLGQCYGLGGKDINYLVLTGRHEGEDLIPEVGHPRFVFIARPLIEDLLDRDSVIKEDLEVIAWGEIYKSKHDAQHHVVKKRN